MSSMSQTKPEPSDEDQDPGCMICSLATSLVTFMLFLVTLIDSKKHSRIGSIPSVSLLSLNGTAAPVNITTTDLYTPTRCSTNVTAVFSISTRNKVPIIYSDFDVTGSQYDVTGHYYQRKDFITAGSVPSVESLEQSGESRDTVAISLPNATLSIESWTVVRVKDDETASTGLARVSLSLHLNARYAAGGKKRNMLFISGDHVFLAEIVVYSGGSRSPDLNFTVKVTDLIFNDRDLSSMAYWYLGISIISGLIAFSCFPKRKPSHFLLNENMVQ